MGGHPICTVDVTTLPPNWLTFGRAQEACDKSKEYRMRTITPPEHQEGMVARAIEEQTAKLPSDTFLWLAGASMATSLTLKLMGKSHDALFVGQWAAPFLLLGIYNKIVKVAGSD
jgi:hypothetical protein